MSLWGDVWLIKMGKLKKIKQKKEKSKKIGFDLIKQFKNSLEDVKAGRIRRVA